MNTVLGMNCADNIIISKHLITKTRFNTSKIDQNLIVVNQPGCRLTLSLSLMVHISCIHRTLPGFKLTSMTK